MSKLIAVGGHLRRLLVLFRGLGNHRYLHSFPTRRSSDRRGPFQPGRRDGAEGQRGRREGPADPARPHAARRDRKSTRLNSSHGYISYAVFCLKKQNLRDEPPMPNKDVVRGYLLEFLEEGR